MLTNALKVTLSVPALVPLTSINDARRGKVSVSRPSDRRQWRQGGLCKASADKTESSIDPRYTPRIWLSCKSGLGTIASGKRRSVLHRRILFCKPVDPFVSLFNGSCVRSRTPTKSITASCREKTRLTEFVHGVLGTQQLFQPDFLRLPRFVGDR